jgi:hypothetical protein
VDPKISPYVKKRKLCYGVKKKWINIRINRSTRAEGVQMNDEGG